MPINGDAIVEYSLKTLLMLIDAGFLLSTITFLRACFQIARDQSKTEKVEDKQCSQWINLFILSVLCGIITVILFGLAIMPWWT